MAELIRTLYDHPICTYFKGTLCSHLKKTTLSSNYNRFSFVAIPTPAFSQRSPPQQPIQTYTTRNTIFLLLLLLLLLISILRSGWAALFYEHWTAPYNFPFHFQWVWKVTRVQCECALGLKGKEKKFNIVYRDFIPTTHMYSMYLCLLFAAARVLGNCVCVFNSGHNIDQPNGWLSLRWVHTRTRTNLWTHNLNAEGMILLVCICVMFVRAYVFDIFKFKDIRERVNRKLNNFTLLEMADAFFLVCLFYGKYI